MTDAYGFTQEEKLFLAQEGWTDSDIDSLFYEDVSPADMLALALADRLPNSTLSLLRNNWTIEEILAFDDRFNSSDDDGPVMDRTPGGKYDS